MQHVDQLLTQTSFFIKLSSVLGVYGLVKKIRLKNKSVIVYIVCF